MTNQPFTLTTSERKVLGRLLSILDNHLSAAGSNDFELDCLTADECREFAAKFTQWEQSTLTEDEWVNLSESPDQTTCDFMMLAYFSSILGVNEFME